MKLSLITLAACLAASGCGWSHDLKYDFQGRDQDLYLAIDAAEIWNAKCGTRLSVAQDHDGDVLIVAAQPTDHQGWAGWTHRDNLLHQAYSISYVPQIKTSDQWKVFAHEMGHSMGLEHSNDPESIMFHNGGAAQIRPEDCP